MNLDEARKIFERNVLASRTDCAIVEEATREFPSCFAFAYQGNSFLKTGELAHMLVGQGFVLISRIDGSVFETGSALPLHRYVEAFEACGDPFAAPTPKVKIVGWDAGADKSRATQLVKQTSEMGLAQAKSVIDRVLSGQDARFTARTMEYAERAIVGLKEIGFHSRQLWSNQG